MVSGNAARKGFKGASLAFLFALLLTGQNSGLAGPLLNPQTTLTDVKIMNNGVEESYILFQSVLNPALWYCVSQKPKLIEKTIDGQLEPEMAIIKYQRVDEKRPKDLLQGAYLRFSFDIGCSEDIIKKLIPRIPPVPGVKVIRLTPLPVEDMELFIFAPNGGTINSMATPTAGIASNFSSREVTFLVPFTSAVDAALMESVLDDREGIKYGIRYNFKVLNAPVKADANPWGTRKRGRGNQRQRDDLTRIMEIEKGDEFLKTASKKGIKGPGKMTRAAREKEREIARKRVDLSRNERNLRANFLLRGERTGKALAVLGKLSFYDYPPEVKERHIFIETDETWRKAYMAMPSIGQPAGLEINFVTMDVIMDYQGMEYNHQIFTWYPEKGWTDQNGYPVVYGKFPLDLLLTDHEDGLSETKFLINYETHLYGTDLLKSHDEAPISAGDVPITSPNDFAELVVLDFSFMTWQPPRLEPPDPGERPDPDDHRISRIDIVLQEGDRKLSKTIIPRIVDDSVIYPENFYWLANRALPGEEPSKVQAYITFFLASTRKVIWSYSGQNLRDLFPTLNVTFFDEDVQPR